MINFEKWPGTEMTRLVTLLSFVVLVSACQTLPNGEPSVAATWLYGINSIPGKYTKDHKDKIYKLSKGTVPWTAVAEKDITPGIKIPVVVYMHGCNGYSEDANTYRKLMMSEGYAVVMPNSFARRRVSPCHDGGPLSFRVELRSQEVKYALSQLHKLPWVDQHRLILMGFSEGGNTVDYWSKPGFEAEIVLGSACTLESGSPNAPSNVPVLAIVGSHDYYRPGMSCTIKRTIGGSRSVVIPDAGHHVASYEKTILSIKEFLDACCRM